MPRMPYLAATSGCRRHRPLAIGSAGVRVLATSSSTGAIIRHGPHHSAQKSTSTGQDLSTSSLKVASVTQDVFAHGGRSTQAAHFDKDRC